MNAGRLQQRAALLAAIRQFFHHKQVLEVETPLLSRSGNSDPNINSICTTDSPPRYLRTSPEYPMKRLLAAGCGDIYELGRVFRAQEQGSHHNPEFTLLEWYRLGWNYRQLMDEVEALVHFTDPHRFRHWTRRDFSYAELFQTYAGIDPFSASDARLQSHCEQLAGRSPGAISRNACLDLILSSRIQPQLPTDQFTFVCDYPSDQAALATIRDGEPPLAERFELYLGRQELANGYQELTDAAEQRQRFQQDNRRRQAAGLVQIPLDEKLLAAMDKGLPRCAGVALGVDRLLMAINDSEHIDQVLAFPWEQA